MPRQKAVSVLRIDFRLGSVTMPRRFTDAGARLRIDFRLGSVTMKFSG